MGFWSHIFFFFFFLIFKNLKKKKKKKKKHKTKTKQKKPHEIALELKTDELENIVPVIKFTSQAVFFQNPKIRLPSKPCLFSCYKAPYEAVYVVSLSWE